MTPSMFMYQNKNAINKAIAKHFGVTKIKAPKVNVFSQQLPDNKYLWVAFYDAHTNNIGINKQLWDVSTNYERFNTVVHEFVHAYQHAHSLCEFDDYDIDYKNRTEEVHCVNHTSLILQELGIAIEHGPISMLFGEEVVG